MSADESGFTTNTHTHTLMKPFIFVYEPHKCVAIVCNKNVYDL